MKNILIITGLILLCSACKKKINESLIQEKSINGFELRLQYLPGGDKDLLRFRLNVRNSDGATMKHTEHVKFNYGLDSLFAFVRSTDTILPVDVIRIANGNVNGIEFMLLFNRPANYSLMNYQLVFKDWLFTSQLMTFPIEGSTIAHVDSFNQPL